MAGNSGFVGSRSRTEYILSLVPLPNADSDPESEDEEVANVTQQHESFISSETELERNFEIHTRYDEEIVMNDQENVVTLNEEVSVPTQSNIRKRIIQNGKIARETFSWKKADFEFPVQIGKDNFHVPDEIKSSLDYFKAFFCDEIIATIVSNTNLYSTQKTASSINTTKTEMCDFIAIELLMGVVQMPAYTDYWSQSFRYEKVASIMSLKRYQILRRFLYFVNNDIPNNDRYFKIRPILELLRRNCNSIENEKRQSVDEMMIPYKGTRAGSRRQYVKNKPKKWGYKMFVRAGVSGIVYDFILYGGANTFSDINLQFSDKENSTGFGGKVVLGVCKTIPDKPLSAVYFDNYFTSPELLLHLRNEYGILSLGTIRSNRLRGCTLTSDKALIKRGRGTYEQFVDNNKKIVVVKWVDNKAVVLASTFVATEPVDRIKRFSKEAKTKIDIDCPHIVKQYNSHMGGVDLADMLVALYRTAFKTHRWYLGVFSQLLNISVNNAWLLYRRDKHLLGDTSKQLTLKEFRLQIVNSLLLRDRSKRGRPSRGNASTPPRKILAPTQKVPQEDIRFDNVGHFPIYGKKGRCRACSKGQTAIFCQKSNIRLCLVDSRNCFLKFHVKNCNSNEM